MSLKFLLLGDALPRAREPKASTHAAPGLALLRRTAPVVRRMGAAPDMIPREPDIAERIAVEPACAASTAALPGPLSQVLAGKRVVLVLCGSNTDWPRFERDASLELSRVA